MLCVATGMLMYKMQVESCLLHSLGLEAASYSRTVLLAGICCMQTQQQYLLTKMIEWWQRQTGDMQALLVYCVAAVP